jgi:hypothetical protein
MAIQLVTNSNVITVETHVNHNTGAYLSTKTPNAKLVPRHVQSLSFCDWWQKQVSKNKKDIEFEPIMSTKRMSD